MNRLWCLALLSLALSVYGQPTKPPNNAGSTTNGVPMVWQPYTKVTVYINGTVFPPGSAMEAAVEQGFINNQNAYGTNDGVTYSFVNIGNATPTLTQNTVYVTDGLLQIPNSGDNYTGQFESAQFNPPIFNSVYGEDFTTYGTLTVNSVLVNPGQYQSATGVTYAASHGDSHYDGLGRLSQLCC